ncbi:MAG: methionyl-tRNA formyltransferase [Acidobacteria bacterium]|nr:MAG: methionyl-tRNA formyltransferase [Acidobacteriota bacterium]
MYTLGVRLVFFGTPDFAVPTLEAIVAARHEVLLVVTRPDQPSGRHLHMTAPAAVAAARRLGLPLAQPEKLGVDDFLARLRALAPEVAVVVAFGRLISPRVLRVPRRGFINLHPSLLPRYRGPSPIESAIAAGDETTGVTTMLLDEGMDTGPILLQREVAIGPRERAPELEARLATLGADLVVETLAKLADGTLTATAQDPSRATVTGKLDRKLGRIDWQLGAGELACRCRAFDPWPGLFTNFRGARLKVHGLEAAAAPAGDEAPGTVVAVSTAGIAVRCGGGTVALLTEVQREGKRRMPADAFIIGERVAPGERFR